MEKEGREKREGRESAKRGMERWNEGSERDEGMKRERTGEGWWGVEREERVKRGRGKGEVRDRGMEKGKGEG